MSLELKISWETRSCIVRFKNDEYNLEKYRWELGAFHTWEIEKESVKAIVEIWNCVCRVDPEDIVFIDEESESLKYAHDIQKKDPEGFKKRFKNYIRSNAQN